MDNSPYGYISFDTLEWFGEPYGFNELHVVARNRSDKDFARHVVKASAALEAHFERNGLRVDSVQTMAAERAEASVVYGIVISLMLIMAILLAIVGGLGLMGTMSINVLERTREIGVLRAVGAPNRGVALAFVREGIAIGLLSWLLGSVLAFPLSKLLSDAVGMAMVGTPLTFSYHAIYPDFQKLSRPQCSHRVLKSVLCRALLSCVGRP